MIIDYKLNKELLPSERDVWLMSRRAERDGHKITRSILNAMADGEVKYTKGQFWRLCRDCMDYLPLEEFYSNKRYILEVGYICKKCTARRRRIKQYGTVSFISDSGMKSVPAGVTIKMKNETKKIIKGVLNEST